MPQVAEAGEEEGHVAMRHKQAIQGRNVLLGVALEYESKADEALAKKRNAQSHEFTASAESMRACARHIQKWIDEYEKNQPL